MWGDDQMPWIDPSVDFHGAWLQRQMAGQHHDEVQNSDDNPLGGGDGGALEDFLNGSGSGDPLVIDGTGNDVIHPEGDMTIGKLFRTIEISKAR